MKNSRIREFFYSLKNLIYNNGKDLRGMKVEKNSLKLLASRAVNKLGDVLYDYGNSSWIASMGSFGQKMLGIYQIVEVVIAIILIHLVEQLQIGLGVAKFCFGLMGFVLCCV